MQAVELHTRLRERGYSKSLLRKAYNKALNRDRTSLFHSKIKPNPDQQTTKFITKYSAQHQQLRICMAKHWHLLSEDLKLQQYVRKTPEIVFQKSPSIGDKLTASHYRPKCRKDTLPKGTHPCGQCTYCPWIQTGTSLCLPNAERFGPRCYATCNTPGVIYLMKCRCGAFYVGKMICPLKKRFYDHICYSQSAKMLTPVSRHLGLYHRFDTTMIQFIVLEVVPQDPCGGNWDKRILQKETYWIERLEVTKPTR